MVENEKLYNSALAGLHKQQRDLYSDLKVPRFWRVVLTIFTLICVIVIPIIVAFKGEFPGKPVLHVDGDFIVILMVLLLVGILNVTYVTTYNSKWIVYQNVRAKLIENGLPANEVLEVPRQSQHRLIDSIQYGYIAGTIVASALWFVFPETSRLEPLTILYGFGTALFAYFRTRFGEFKESSTLT